MKSAEMRIGVFGGSFNPVHVGHIELIRKIQILKKYDKLLVVPCKIQPLKAPLEFSETDRLEMLRLALKNPEISGVEISDFELKSEGPSYSINTVKHFKNVHPSSAIELIVGTDTFDGIGKWHQIDELLKLCSFLVVERKSHKSAVTAQTVELDLPAVSASEIREKLALGKPLSGLVPPETELYLEGLKKKSGYVSQ